MPATLDPEQVAQARDSVVQNIYAPALFDKLASHGIRPQTAAEADTLVKMALSLSAVPADPAKEAADRFAQPAADLGVLLTESKQAQTDQVQEIAVTLAANDELYKHAQLLRQAQEVAAA